MAWTATGLDLTGPQGPRGPKGEDGKSVSITGTVDTSADLPTGLTEADAGKGWVTADDGHLHVWSGTEFTDVGQVKGDPGPEGPQGERGQRGPAGEAASVTIGQTVTGQPGTSAKVENTGDDSAAVLQFTVPQGPKGDKGDAGATGSDGAKGQRGSKWFVGHGDANGADIPGGLVGDMYLDLDSGQVWYLEA